MSTHIDSELIITLVQIHYTLYQETRVSSGPIYAYLKSTSVSKIFGRPI
ncbi:hypothetical protein [Aquimarina hainanensis]